MQFQVDDSTMEIGEDEDVFKPWYSRYHDDLLRLPALRTAEKVLDMGTGSGVLPIAWAKRFTNIKKIYAVDKHQQAIECAKRNIARCLNNDEQKKIIPRSSDLFSNIKKGTRFDVIVFNAPHVPAYLEPGRAELDGLYDPDFEVLRRFFRDAADFLTKEGLVYYTFSDYAVPCTEHRPGEHVTDKEWSALDYFIQQLREVEKELGDKRWIVSVHCVSRFHDYLVEQPKGKQSPCDNDEVKLWYTFEICPISVEDINKADKIEGHNTEDKKKDKKKTENEKTLLNLASNMLRSFRRATFSIRKLYSTSEFNARVFSEYRRKICSLVRVAHDRLGCFLQDNHWIATGYSAPDWLSGESMFQFAYASQSNGEQINKFDRAINELIERIRKERNDVRLAADVLMRDKLFEAIEADVWDSNSNFMKVLSFPRKLYTGFAETDIEAVPPAPFPADDYDKIIEEGKKITERMGEWKLEENDPFAEIVRREGINFKDKTTESNLNDSAQKVVPNLFLNFTRISFHEKRMKYAYFQRIPNPLANAHGVVYLFSSIGLRKAQSCWLVECFQHLYDLMEATNMCISYPVLESHLLGYARQAAAAAILSRNMSHNIGSHVIPRAGTKNIWDRVKDLYEKGAPRGDNLLSIVGLLKDHLDDYIRQKSDFLAEITTEPASSSSTAYLYRDVILPFITNTILMDCLTANEGLRYRKIDECALRLRLLVSEDDKESIEIRAIVDSADSNRAVKGFVAPYLMRMPDNFEDLSLYIEEEDQDVMIALPGALGQFAVYGILENLIRNAAKHNRQAFHDENRDLEITLLLKDDTNDSTYYSLLIYDNATAPEQEVERDNEKRKIHEFIQQELDRNIIVTETGQVRRSSWGLAEMVICGNLLIGSTSFANVESTEDKESKPVVSASAKIPPKLGNDVIEEKRLIYEFKLLKARQALVVGKELANALLGAEDSETAEDSERQWLRAGIVVKRSWDDFHKFLTDTRVGLASFQFAVIEERGAIRLQLEERQRLPFRIIRVNPDAPADSIDQTTGDVIVRELLKDGETWPPTKQDRFLCRLWMVWCRRWMDLDKGRNPTSEKKGLVSIYLDNIGDMKLAGQWKKAAEQFNASDTPLLLKATWKLTNVPPETLSNVPSELSKEAPAVFFDRHGGAVEKKEIGPDDSYLAFDKANEDFIRIFQPRFPRHEAMWSFPYEMFEAGMLRVLILDERLAERAMNPIDPNDKTLSNTRHKLVGEKGPALCMWHVAYGACVLIATHVLVPGTEDPLATSEPDADKKKTGEFDVDKVNKLADKLVVGALHRASFRKSVVRYQEELQSSPPPSCPMLTVDLRMGAGGFNLYVHRKGPLASDQGSKDNLSKGHIDMIVVHQGILDMHQHAFGDKDLLAHLHDVCPWVIVESGRGMPPKVQENYEKFLPFSALDRCFGEKRIAKLMLCKRLMERTRAKYDHPSAK